MRPTSATVMVIFSKEPFRKIKLLDHSYVKVSSEKLRGAFWKISRTWIKIRANSFIKTLVKHHETKINKAVLKIITNKRIRPHFKGHCTKIDISLVIIGFLFSQTNLVFKPNQYLSTYCIIFASLFTFFTFDYWYPTDFEVHPVPLQLFYKNK